MLASLLSVSQSLIGYENVSYESYVVTPGYWAQVPAINSVHFGRDGWGNLFVGNIGMDMLGSWIHPLSHCWVNGEWRNGQIDATPWPWVSVSPDPTLALEYFYETTSWNPSGNVGFKTLSEWNSLQTDVTSGTKRNLTGSPVYG